MVESKVYDDCLNTFYIIKNDFKKLNERTDKMDILSELSQYGLTQSQYEECVQLILDKKNGINDLDWQEICNKYNLPISPDNLRRVNSTIFGGSFIAEYFKNKDYISTQSIEEIQNTYGAETTINKDGTYSSNRLLSMNEEESKDPDYILKAHGFDPACWKIISARNNVRQVISKQDGIVTLYASFITVKPVAELTLKQIEDFYKDLIDKFKTPIIKQYKNCQSGLMLEIPIQDVHFGKLSLVEDVAEPYNFNLAKERFGFVIDDVIRSVSGFDIEKIIFPIGSDFFHIDNVDSATTAGTRQSTDLSPQLIFKYGLECLVENILKLSKVAPVEVFCVNGNHDFLSSYHAICALQCYFHNNENVTVNTDTSPRKYVEFGNVLLGFSHGNKEKNRIEGIMQIEAREAWGRTKYHEFHLGHLHSEHTKEVNGVIIRNLSSFTGIDAWHHNSGYVGAVKKCQSFLWDKEKGLKNIIVTTID